MRELHQSGTGPLYKYLRYEISTTVGALTEVDGSPQQPTATVNDREPSQDEVEDGEVVRHQDDCGVAVQEQVGGDEEVPKEMSKKLRRPAQTNRQTTTELSTSPPDTISTRPPPPPAATSTTPTGSLSKSLPPPTRSLSRHGDPRLGFADVEELDDSVVDDVREQDDDREAAIVQDDGGGAVRDNDVQGPGGVEEVQKTRFDSSVKTRSRRQIRRAM